MMGAHGTERPKNSEMRGISDTPKRGLRSEAIPRLANGLAINGRRDAGAREIYGSNALFTAERFARLSVFIALVARELL